MAVASTGASAGFAALIPTPAATTAAPAANASATERKPKRGAGGARARGFVAEERVARRVGRGHRETEVGPRESARRPRAGVSGAVETDSIAPTPGARGNHRETLVMHRARGFDDWEINSRI